LQEDPRSKTPPGGFDTKTYPGRHSDRLQITKGKLAFCDEFLAARKTGGDYAAALRRVAKRHEAIATARPFSVAMVGLGDHFLYTCGTLCYTLDDQLRILELYRSERDEAVVSISGLLRMFLPESAQDNGGIFRILYCNENIVSCLYTSNTPDCVAYLIAFEKQKGTVHLVYELPSTEKIFVRHNSSYLYYGTYSEEDFHGHKKWVLRGYSFEREKWFPQRVFLGDLNGCELGSTICFEIFDGYFYALSNQTNYEVEEVDWTSFYHCIRFPICSPSKDLLEKTAMDEHMWRRQHREGPIDDRWTNLALKIDEATGELKILETRREFLFGAGRGQRTYYTTKLVFPKRKENEAAGSQKPYTTTTNSTTSGSLSGMGFDEPYSRNGIFEKHTLAALTNDRLALTLKPSDNPHWLPPQIRFPRNFHCGDDGHYIFSQTYLRYYNFSAKTFLDLVDDAPSTNSTPQRLRLRVGSRKLNPPARDCNDLLIPEAIDSITGEILNGLNDTYTAREIAFWPPEQNSPDADRLEEIYTLMNPPTHLGGVEVMGDDRSFVYVTGGKDQPKAIIFVNFDPANNLGLRKWPEKRKIPQSGGQYEDECGWYECPEKYMGTGKGKELPKKATAQHQSCSEMTLSEPGVKCITINGEGWISRDAAMYVDIDRGFDFGL
jgi:hypothetical protein